MNVSIKSYNEIKNIILAGQLLPVSQLSLNSLLEHSKMSSFKNVILNEIQKFVFENPEVQKDYSIDGTDVYIQIDLLKALKNILVRYVGEADYLLGVATLESKNIIPDGINKEIQELKKLKTHELKNELSAALKWYKEVDEKNSNVKRAMSLAGCIIKSIIYSRSILGKIEGFIIKNFKEISCQNIEKEIYINT